MKRKIKIGVPQLVNAEFTIDVNGTICRNRIDSKGKIGYYIEDYKKVDYAGLTDAKPVFDAVESLLQEFVHMPCKLSEPIFIPHFGLLSKGVYNFSRILHAQRTGIYQSGNNGENKQRPKQ
jgi:hypothetical protein